MAVSTKYVDYYFRYALFLRKKKLENLSVKIIIKLIQNLKYTFQHTKRSLTKKYKITLKQLTRLSVKVYKKRSRIPFRGTKNLPLSFHTGKY